MRRIALLLLLAMFSAAAGAFVTWQYLAIRVYMAEGVRDMYMLVLAETSQQCAPKPSPWPKRRGP